MPSEVSQIEKGKYYAVTHMWNLKYDTDELLWNRNRFTDIEKRVGDAKEKRGWEKDGVSFGD